MAFIVIGAYTSAIVSMPLAIKATMLPHLPGALGRLQLGLVPATLLAALFAACVAFVVGLVLMRLAGLAAGIATLGLLVLTQVVVVGSEDLTRGVKILTPIPIDLTLGAALAMAMVAVLVAFLYQRFALKEGGKRDGHDFGHDYPQPYIPRRYTFGVPSGSPRRGP
ncbi:hypothetical protein [Pseudonocardia ailaonensis]